MTREHDAPTASELDELVRRLPRDVEPPPELWPRIAALLDAPSPRSLEERARDLPDGDRAARRPLAADRRAPANGAARPHARARVAAAAAAARRGWRARRARRARPSRRRRRRRHGPRRAGRRRRRSGTEHGARCLLDAALARRLRRGGRDAAARAHARARRTFAYRSGDRPRARRTPGSASFGRTPIRSSCNSPTRTAEPSWLTREDDSDDTRNFARARARSRPRRSPARSARRRSTGRSTPIRAADSRSATSRARSRSKVGTDEPCTCPARSRTTSSGSTCEPSAIRSWSRSSCARTRARTTRGTSLKISAPQAHDLEVDTVSASISVRGIEGEQRLRSVSGSIDTAGLHDGHRAQLRERRRDGARQRSASRHARARDQRHRHALRARGPGGGRVGERLGGRDRRQAAARDAELDLGHGVGARQRWRTTHASRSRARAGTWNCVFKGDAAAEYDLTSFSGRDQELLRSAGRPSAERPAAKAALSRRHVERARAREQHERQHRSLQGVNRRRQCRG